MSRDVLDAGAQADLAYMRSIVPLEKELHMTIATDIQNNAGARSHSSQNSSKGATMAAKPNTTTTVSAITAEMTVKEVIAKYPALNKMFNAIEIQEFDERGTKGFQVGQVTFLKQDAKGTVSRRNWVKIGMGQDSPIFAMKKSWKDDKGAWQRAKRATVSGHKFEDDDKYTISRAIERAALNVMTRHLNTAK